MGTEQSAHRIRGTAPAAPKADMPYRVTRVTFRFEGIGVIDDAIQDVYVVDLKAGTTNRITDDGALNEDPRWAADGTRLLFRGSLDPERE